MPHELIETRQKWLEQPCLSLFGVWLRSKRHALGLSQEEFAFQSRVSLQMITDYERGKHHPGKANGPKLAQFLSISEDELKREIQKSLDYWNERGEEGIRELMAKQPRASNPRKAFKTVFSESQKAYQELREANEPTGWVKVTLPQSYEIAITQIAAKRDVSVSSLLGAKIMELIDANEWE